MNDLKFYENFNSSKKELQQGTIQGTMTNVKFF